MNTYSFFILLHSNLPVQNVIVHFHPLFLHLSHPLRVFDLLVVEQLLLLLCVVLLQAHLSLVLLLLFLIFDAQVLLQFQKFHLDFVFTVFTYLLDHSESIFCSFHITVVILASLSSRSVSCSRSPPCRDANRGHFASGLRLAWGSASNIDALVLAS